MDYAKLLEALGDLAHPTVRKYREHIEICKRNGVEPESFEQFANDVLGTPEAARAWLLKPEPAEPYIAFQRFAQYASPTMEEQKLGLSGTTIGKTQALVRRK